MVRVTPDQQRRFVAEHPAVFVPENGAWGRQGCTRVVFATAEVEVVGEAITLAWQNAASARPARVSRQRAAKSQRVFGPARKLR